MKKFATKPVRHFVPTAFFATLMWGSACFGADAPQTLSLQGAWQFGMNGPKMAPDSAQLPTLALRDTIELPGTTETRKKGTARGAGWNGQLTRVYKFEGPAWYQREITIPPGWNQKRVSLFLERTKPSQVWVDGRSVGQQVILTAPQEYTLGALSPGVHKLTVLVDNSIIPIPGDMHQLSDNTQGNWNGLLGKLELRATDAVWLEDVQVYPDVSTRTVKVRVQIGNSGGKSGAGTLFVQAKGRGISGGAARANVKWSATGSSASGSSASGSIAEMTLPLGKNAALWDEFSPNLHSLSVQLRGAGVQDSRTLTFGLRQFTSGPNGFAINGRPTFLRGKHDAAVFPLTGHPPMDVAGWRRYLSICKAWGINHIRCHTWTPPEAAFIAADELGMYFQPEIPFWGDFTAEIKAKVKPEGERIMRAYGNHPSFVMFSLGNENRNSREIMGSLVSELRALDNRHLYVQGSNNFAWDPQLPAGDDFLISARVKNSPQSPSRNVRGSHATVDSADAHVQAGPANTLKDYSEAVAGMAKPVIGHEVGQYTTYPDFQEIPRYTGVMRADNLASFRAKLEKSGMLGQLDDFARSSEALAQLCYREEIETALRTPGMGGFDLLDLQDFPGQGTALVGILDALMEPKKGIDHEQWLQYCAPVVVLARFPKYGWTSSETFAAQIQVAHYGPADLKTSQLTWNLRDEAGKTVRQGQMSISGVKQGGVRNLGSLSIPLVGIKVPARLNLELELGGTKVNNTYPLWIYSPAPVVVPSNVVVARSFDAKTRRDLSEGKRVFLVLDGKKPLARTVGGGFATDFWNFPMFHNKPGTMGLLVDNKSAALSLFPSDKHSHWQWFDIALQAQPVMLSPSAMLNPSATPQKSLVQVVDNMDRNQNLGLIFEAKVGSGRLLVCASDLLAMQDKIEARQLLASLFAYGASDAFQPQVSMAPAALSEVLMTAIPLQGKATAATEEKSWMNLNPGKAVDSNDYTPWRPDNQETGQFWQFTFDSPQTLRGGEIVWENPGIKYRLETSTDGTKWTVVSDQMQNALGTSHRLDFAADNVKMVRIAIPNQSARLRASINEVRFFAPQD